MLLGEAGVGKTCLVQRFINNVFSDGAMSTIGVSFLQRTIETDSGKSVKLEIWDTAGQETYRSILPLYYKAAGCVLLTFDLTRKSTFEELKKFWVKQIQQQCDPKVIVVLIGNKCDMNDKRQVEESDARSYAEKRKFLYFETSAKVGTNIDTMFKSAASAVHPSLQRSAAPRNVLNRKSPRKDDGGCGC